MNDGAFFYITGVENLYFFHQGESSRIYLISTCNNNNHNNNNNNNNNNHCIKSVCILSYSGPYLVRMRENTDQKNFESGHFSCSESASISLSLILISQSICTEYDYHIVLKYLLFQMKNVAF